MPGAAASRRWLAGKGKGKGSWKPKDEGHNERASLQALFAG